MPDEQHSENKLHLPPPVPEETGNPRKAGHGPAGGKRPEVSGARGGFLSAMAFKRPKRKGFDPAAPPLGEGAVKAVPQAMDPNANWEPEGWESAPPAPETAGAPPRFDSRRIIWFLRTLGQEMVRVDHAFLTIILLVCATAIFASITAWKLGADAGEKRLIEEQTKSDVVVSPEYFERLNNAFENLRAGKSGEALQVFQELETRNPDVASMAYLVALAAMRSGNVALAGERAALSIRKREKVSDAIALQALIQARKSAGPKDQKFGDNELRSELVLRQAILADVSNPLPMIELSALLREHGKNDEALEVLRATRSRVQPVDLIPFVEATIRLATLQASPDGDLAVPGDPDKDLTAAFSAAYIAMRKGRFDEAAKILNSARGRTDPALFRYLMNDQAIRPYSREPQLREFFY
jgi:thioredoxin-like negative regulator of GroEL